MTPKDQTSRPAQQLKPCPICGKPASGTTRPFCSQRCADVDLHRWLGGRYVVPSTDVDPDDPDSLPPDEAD